jgi:hypothetical protein
MALQPLEHGPRGIALLGAVAAAAGHLWCGLSTQDTLEAREAASGAWLWLACAVGTFAFAWPQGRASAPRRALLHAFGLLTALGAVYTMAAVPKAPFFYVVTLFGGVAAAAASLAWAPAPLAPPPED